MKTDYEKQLETAIDRELKALPELSAPKTLLPRVLASIQRQQRAPWYHQSWLQWPVPARVTVFALLAALFGGLCFGAWQVGQGDSLSAVVQPASGLLRGALTLWHAAVVLLESLILAVRSLGTWFLAGCLAIIMIGYASCLGLGSLWLRLAFAKR